MRSTKRNFFLTVGFVKVAFSNLFWKVLGISSTSTAACRVVGALSTFQEALPLSLGVRGGCVNFWEGCFFDACVDFFVV